MYSSASAASLSSLWMAATRFISATGVVHQRLAADAERGVGAERLDEQRHPQVAAGLEVAASARRRRSAGYRMSSKARSFLLRPLSWLRYSSPGPLPV